MIDIRYLIGFVLLLYLINLNYKSLTENFYHLLQSNSNLKNYI